MPLFGNLKHSRSKKESGEHDPLDDRIEPKGSIFKHLPRRTSSLSVKDEPPVAAKKTFSSHNYSHIADTSSDSHTRPSSAISKDSHLDEKVHAQAASGTKNDAPSDLHVGTSSTNSTGILSRTTATASVHSSDSSTDENGLSRDDVRHLFAGAPHFILEAGTHGRSFPQVMFPWDKSLDVADLQGRQLLKHESFALSTLHAHLPIPDALDWQPTSIGPYKQADPSKRPAFELGIFESPNMLGMHGKEPGTVGMRYFLEIPVADKCRTSKQAKDAACAHTVDVANMSTTEAIKALQNSNGSPMIGKHAPWQDRLRLINGGPRAWKRVGVREISMQTITDRLARISSWHEEVVTAGWKVTILDKQDYRTLHEELFTHFLFPSENTSNVAGPQSMKQQLEALYKVLTTPGAWIDFSLVASRLRLGQVLWEVSPQDADKRGKDKPAPGMERWWLLVQILLSIELVIRLDASLRLGLAEHTGEYHISAEDIHHFNRLRNTKLDWDLVLARRFLDYIQVIPAANRSSEMSLLQKSNRPGLMSRLSHRSSETIGVISNETVWNCLLLPRRPKSQLDGLLRFARFVNWPDFTDFECHMLQELNEASLASQSFLEVTYARPICPTSMGPQSCMPETVALESATKTHPGGWLSRSWFTGLVLPGDTACHLLISTLLENSPQVLAKVGTTALLQGGFILDGGSWWSMACVVGRVLAPWEGASECMGWISIPKLLPVSNQGVPLPNRWVHVEAAKIPTRREKTRIHDGVQMSVDSSPLGTGQGKVMGREFSMPGLGLIGHAFESQISLTSFVLRETQLQGGPYPGKTIDNPFQATVQFSMKTTADALPSEVSFRLKHDVYFVSAQPCRPPHGHAVHTSPDGKVHPIHEPGQALPAHPLHHSYRYVLKSVPELISMTPPNYLDPKEAVWIIDARRSREKDIFVRAWCSVVGSHAIVSRIGRTCLSCSIREARAIEVGVIIRVGGND